jgi:ATP-binding cassette, subfamily G (WHITE), member 2
MWQCWNPGMQARPQLQGIQNRFGLLFFILLFLSLMSLSSLPIWKETMLLFFRERDAGTYSTTAFYVSRVLFDVVPLRVIPPLFFMVITYPMVGLHAGSVACTLSFGAALVLGNVASTLLCMLLGAALPSLSLANMVRCPATLVFCFHARLSWMRPVC